MFVRKFFYPLHKVFFLLSLRGLGILNYEDNKFSGENNFIKRFILNNRKKDLIIFDVGANVGKYSILIRKFSQSVRIYAFEPHPKTFQKLKNNAGLYNFNAYDFGLGEEEGVLKFYDYAESKETSHATFLKDVIEKIHKNASVEMRVRMVRLDNFVTENKIDKIDLLKIDTEGNDLMVIKGAEKFIKDKKIDIIQFEFGDMNVIARVFFKDFFDTLPDYNFYRLLPDALISIEEYDPKLHEIFAFQNIVAVRKGLEWKY